MYSYACRVAKTIFTLISLAHFFFAIKFAYHIAQESDYELDNFEVDCADKIVKK